MLGAMPDAALRLMTVAEFLDWDDGTDTVYELVRGQPVPLHHERVRGQPVGMAPPLPAHALLIGQTLAEIARNLRPPCRPFSGAGIRIPDRDDTYYVADVAVSCSLLFADDRWVPDPVLIVEVLSPTTTDRDRSVKLQDYRSIPSVRDILLVDARRRHVEHWGRDADHWLVQDLVGSAVVELRSLGASVALDRIYDGLSF